MNPLLQINSNQVEDILIDSQLIPIGAIKGDLILIRSKLCLDKLLLYKVENILTSVTKQPLAQPQQQRRIGSISLSSQYATNFNWIKPHRNTQVELDLVSSVYTLHYPRLTPTLHGNATVIHRF